MIDLPSRITFDKSPVEVEEVRFSAWRFSDPGGISDFLLYNPITHCRECVRGVRRLIFLILFLSGTCSVLIGQEKAKGPSCIYRESIQIIDTAKGFVSNVTVQSIPIPDYSNYYVNYTSLEEVTEYETRYYTDKGKWKLFRKGDVSDIQTPVEHFYSCQRTVLIELPKKEPFQVNYQIKTTDLILQSSMLFFNPFPIDTFYYEITVPHDYSFRYKIIYPELLSYFKFDSVIGKHEIIYYLTGVPAYKESNSNEEPWFQIKKHRCTALTIVTPREFYGNETGYYNDWVMKKIRPKGNLNEKSKALIDSLTGSKTEKDTIIETLFNYVRDHIKYLDVLIGYGAYIPHNVNKVLRTRQGDCKDMAFLLCQALRYKGIEAKLALASTGIHFTDMTFPSLSAANHMICTVKRNDRWLFLDPTAKSGSWWIPALGIQGSKVLILDTENGLYETVAPSEPEMNREYFLFALRLNNDSLTGTLHYTAYGAAMQYLKYLYTETTQTEWSLLSSSILNKIMKGVSIDHPNMVQTTDSIVISCRLSVSPVLIAKNGSSTYINLGFLPIPMISFHCKDYKGDVILNYKTLRSTDIRIETDPLFQSAVLKPMLYDQDGYYYEINTEKMDQTIAIKSKFRCEKLLISKEECPDYKKFSEFISKTRNNAIIFK